MMGPCQRIESKLFYAGIRLEDRIPEDHILRKINSMIDFGFVRREVGDFYGVKGNCSVDPVALMKLMLLLQLEQVPSERKLMEQLRYRLDWMWFCGYDFDDPIPDHSVLSKARRRWGTEVFTRLFEEVLVGCIDGGLVDGSIVHVDSSLIAADASKDTLRPALRVLAEELYNRLEDSSEQSEAPIRPGALISDTDPDARLTRKYGQSVLGYKDHRVVDDRSAIITATVTTDAAKADGEVLEEVLDHHERNTTSKVESA